jgi:cytochrome c peroxidase
MPSFRAVSRPALLAATIVSVAASCFDPPPELEDRPSELGATFSRRTTNPNAQLVATWLHRNTSAAVSFASPISSPDGHLVVQHSAGNSFAVAVVVPPLATSHSGTQIAPRFGDALVVRDGTGAPVLVPIGAPASVGWSQNTSEQMALGADPRLAGGLPVRIAAAGATTNCFAADPTTVVTAAAGPYECGRYLLFMPGRTGTGGNNTIHVAALGVVTDAYAPTSPTLRKPKPVVVAAKFLTGFAALPASSIGIELSVTADSRLLLSHAGHSRFSWSETPWIASSWGPPRSFTCIATPMGKACPGVAANCTANPNGCGMANRPVCLAGRDGTGACKGSEPLFRDRYPVAQYPLRNSDGSLYAGRTSDGVLQPSLFGGTYGWITFDGDAFFFNSASNRGGRAVVGRLTRGMIRTLDAQANVAPIAYCVAANQLRPVAGCPGGTDSDGLRQPLPMGNGDGLWRLFSEEPNAVLPLTRRVPMVATFEHNQLLGNVSGIPAFNTSVAASVHDARYIYTETSFDDAMDEAFAVFFHMNPALAPNWDRDQPLLTTHTVDTTGNYYRATFAGGAGFAGTVGAGTLNTGYLGRALQFPPAGSAVVTRTVAGAGPLTAPMPSLTLELAVRTPAASFAAGAVTRVAELTGMWRLELVGQASGAPALRLRWTRPSGEAVVTSLAKVHAAADTWTHVVFWVAGNDRRVRWFIDGALRDVSAALPADASVTATGLVLGPAGQAPAGAVLGLDELAISNVPRSNEYVAAAAYAVNHGDFDQASSTTTRGPFLFADDGKLPAIMRGLDARELRIPERFLDAVDAARTSGETLRARFNKLRDLGAALFSDDLLTVTWNGSAYVEAKDGRSCLSCHQVGTLASPGVAFNTAIDGALLTANTPTARNRLLSRRQFLDQRAADLVTQALAPIENRAPVEMGGHAVDIAAFINGKRPDGSAYTVAAGQTSTTIVAADGMPGAPPAGVTSYAQWFRSALGAGPTDVAGVPAITADHLALALTAFELSRFDANSAVDQARALGTALPADVAAGMRVFFGKGRCAACHSGSGYSDEQLHAAATAKVAGLPMRTRTPGLRRISTTAPYFRDGSAATLDAVIEQYDTGGCRTTIDGVATSCDPELYPLGLTAAEKTALKAFLLAL